MNEQKGLIQSFHESLTPPEQERFQILEWTPFVLHSHAMVADMRRLLLDQQFTEAEALEMTMWPEAKQPITSRIAMLQKVYGNLFGQKLPIHFSDHAAHPVIDRVYDRSDEEKELQRAAFRDGDVHETIDQLSNLALVRHQLMQELAMKPEYAGVRLLNGIEIDILEAGIRIPENGVTTEVIPGLVDISPEVQCAMDFVQLSYHPDEVEARSGITLEQMTFDRYLNMMVSAMQNNVVDTISHPLRELTPDTLHRFEGALNMMLDGNVDETNADVTALQSFFKQVQVSQVALEFNLSDARDTKPKRQREVAVTTKLLRAAKKYGCEYFTFGSDLHDLGKWKLIDGDLKQKETDLYESTADPENDLPPGDRFDSFEEADAYAAEYNNLTDETLADPSFMKKVMDPYTKHILRLSRYFQPEDFINSAAAVRSGRFDEFMGMRKQYKAR